MAAYQTQQALGRGPSRGVGGSSQEIHAYAEYTLTTWATNDYVEMVRVPLGAIITGVTVYSDDIDSNGSPTATISVGDASSATRFISASTIPQAGGFTSTVASGTGAMFYKYTAEGVIRCTAGTGSATFAAGTIKLKVSYLLDPMLS